MCGEEHHAEARHNDTVENVVRRFAVESGVDYEVVKILWEGEEVDVSVNVVELGWAGGECMEVVVDEVAAARKEVARRGWKFDAWQLKELVKAWDVEGVRLMLRANDNEVRLGEDSVTNLFHRTIEARNLEMLDTLLAFFPDTTLTHYIEIYCVPTCDVPFAQELHSRGFPYPTLHEHARRSTYHVMVYLLTLGVAVDATDEKGWTALHICSDLGDFAIADLLVSVWGADTTLKTNSGDTPADLKRRFIEWSQDVFILG
eukprot:TRINITY_DN2825_c0_g2_i2.p1 TRINITY_DN2825_c0_g2~~TRINITY_DN2825_c0_g2_i2.p1  ORF type:complete len:281 (+),score=66.05 TRINITY_DN2825_c0_g2_i2:69-845(+)